MRKKYMSFDTNKKKLDNKVTRDMNIERNIDIWYKQ